MCVPFSAEIKVFNAYNSVLIWFKGSGANATLPSWNNSVLIDISVFNRQLIQLYQLKHIKTY